MPRPIACPLLLACLLAAPRTAIAPAAAMAATPQDADRALTLIANTADRICAVVRTEGTAQSTKVSGAVTAELGGLVKRLANIGVNGQASFDAAEYKGVLQSDLATALRDSNQCREHIFDKLEAKLVPDLADSGSTATANPLVMTLLASETTPLDGYAFVGSPQLPAGLPRGVVLPGGGRTRLVLQAADPDQIIEIDRVSLTVTRRDVPDDPSLRYVVDPTRQPGFGAARPRRFNVRLIDTGKAESFYIDDRNMADPVRSDNMLADTPFPLLVLERGAGLQETLDFSVVAASPGLYELRFSAHATSQGHEYVLQTDPFYIFRH